MRSHFRIKRLDWAWQCKVVVGLGKVWSWEDTDDNDERKLKQYIKAYPIGNFKKREELAVECWMEDDTNRFGSVKEIMSRDDQVMTWHDTRFWRATKSRPYTSPSSERVGRGNNAEKKTLAIQQYFERNDRPSGRYGKFLSRVSASSNANTARNSKMWRTNGPTDRPTRQGVESRVRD